MTSCSMDSPCVVRVSECFIKPGWPTKEEEESNTKHVYYLTPWDIAMLSVHYIQKGLLFRKPQNDPDFIKPLLEMLKQSLSIALFHFHPLSGRLVTQKQNTQHPPTYFIYVDCQNSPGAKFIYATLDMTISQILSPVDVPLVVQSFFDHDRAVNHDGHTMSLLSVQVTQLIDGIFIGCSMNHSVGDGTSYWNFFNAWSEIFQAKRHQYDIGVPISCPPILDRWFPEGQGPKINLPFKHHDEFISRFQAPKLRERVFHFSSESIAKLKAKANRESDTNKISSFQSLSALVWRSLTRARRVPYDQTTSCKLAINNRRRMEPTLPEEYFGNSIHLVIATTTAGELLQHDFGWAAWKLHLAVANHNDTAVRQSIKNWLESPAVYQYDGFLDPFFVVMGSSPRFNMYGNEFGMGKAVAIRSGYANKFDGKVTSYQGCEGDGSVDLEMCLFPDTMAALESDVQFMEAASVSNFSC